LKPVRTLGGNTLYTLAHSEEDLPKSLSEAEIHMAKLGLQAGPRDQRPVEVCSLTYTTSELSQDLEVTGPLVVRAYVSSTAEDTDFVARLTDVWPDGRSILIADGILRARYREGKTRPVPLRPGEIYLISVDLWSTSNVFRKGHRIRLSITSSNFPRYDRNLNIWKRGGSIADVVVARNTIYHDPDHPSHLVLPVLAEA
jgi:putative CocE/NonD family hydrolase